MSSFMPLTETQSMIFDITKLHQKYWRMFCDVYYVHLGFETEEVHSYEQKYETFCRRKSVSEEKDYEDDKKKFDEFDEIIRGEEWKEM